MFVKCVRYFLKVCKHPIQVVIEIPVSTTNPGNEWTAQKMASPIYSYLSISIPESLADDSGMAGLILARP